MSYGTDLNLLFGVLALQSGFLSQDELVASMRQWFADPQRSLGEILVERGALGEGELTLLEMAVQNQVEKHGTAAGSMAALGYESVALNTLDSAGESETEKTISKLRMNLQQVMWADASSSLGEKTSVDARFRILRHHSSGGLGEVYLARDEELDRQVAVKKIRGRHANDANLCDRFVLEAKITGGLEHPGIVPVYALGRQEDGQPFYAMRFIQGESLTAAIGDFHAESRLEHDPGKRTLALRKLLGHFIDVCNAVAWAHSRGVIHRDIKPDNIMLGRYGETLLVDWGLAKIVGRESDDRRSNDNNELEETLRPASDAPPPSQLGTAIGTLGYMSPEQAAGLVDQLGPASDVFGLGATLYTLLTGKPPFSGENSEAVRHDIIVGRFTPPRGVNNQVPPALEATCLKAMALDPGNRHASAGALADDVEAWLGGEPVSAWREPIAVRVGRWLRRHRTLMTAASAATIVALASLLVGVIVLKQANDRVRRAKSVAVDRQIEARQSFLMACGAVDEYLTKVSQDARLKGHGLEPLRRDLLQTAEDFYQRLVRQRPEDPDLQHEWAWAHFRLADISMQIGSQPESIALLRKANDIFQALSQEHPRDDRFRSGMAKCQMNLGVLFCEGGRAKDALTAFKRSLDISQELVDRHPNAPGFLVELANTRHNMAKLHVDAKLWKDAETDYRAAMNIHKRLAAANADEPRHQRDLAVGQCDLGLLFQMQGRTDEASELLEAARAAQRKLVQQYRNVSDYRSDLATTCNNLGALYGMIDDRHEDALAAHNEALQLRQGLAIEHFYVTHYKRDLARSCNNIAALYCEKGRWIEAKQAYNVAETIHRRLAEEHPTVPAHVNDLASTLSNLANLYCMTGKPDEALPLYEEAIGLRQRLSREQRDNPDYQDDLARTYEKMGSWLTILSRPKEADDAYRSALEIRESLVEEYSHVLDYRIGLGATLATLGNLCSESDQPEAALEYCRRAIDTLNSQSPLVSRSPIAGSSLRNARWGCAEALDQLGRHSEAVTEWNLALESASGAGGNLLRLNRAESLARAGDHAAAVADVEDIVEAAGGHADVLYRLASICAIAAACVSEDENVDTRNKQLADRYGASATAILHEARQAGLFKTPLDVQRLKQDPVFDSVRDRDDFRELLMKLQPD